MVAEQSPTQNSSSTIEENGGNLNPDPSETTNEATIQSNAPEQSESSIKNIESSEISTVTDHAKSLEFSDELMEKGNLAFKEGDFPEAAELFSRALEIRLGFCLFLFESFIFTWKCDLRRLGTVFM